MKYKLLILGISSFAGSNLANHFLKSLIFNYLEHLTKKIVFQLIILKRNNKYKNIKFIKLNLNNKNNNLEKIVDEIKPNYIIDFASICMVEESWKNPELYYQINFVSKINFIKNLYKKKYLKKYIYVSTPEIFGSNNKLIQEDSMFYNPTTPYASSKLALEMLMNNFIKNSVNKIIIARFSNFYGRGQPLYRLIPKIIYCIKNQKKFPLQGNGDSIRNFIFEDDFNNGLFKIIKKGKAGSKYHFSGDEYLTIKNLIKKICKIKKNSYNKLIKKKRAREGQDKCYYLDCEKTKSELNWKCKTNLDHGISETIIFYDSLVNNVNKKYLKFNID